MRIGGNFAADTGARIRREGLGEGLTCAEGQLAEAASGRRRLQAAFAGNKGRCGEATND